MLSHIICYIIILQATKLFIVTSATKGRGGYHPLRFSVRFKKLYRVIQPRSRPHMYFVAFMILVVVKVTVINCGGEIAETVFTHLIHQGMSDLRNRMDLKSHETKECVSQLLDKGIEILNSQKRRQTVVVWIWCPTQEALEHIQNLYESNQMREVFFERIPSSISILIRIERNQFKKTTGKFFYEFTH